VAITPGTGIDVQSLAALRAKAASDPKAAVRETAKAFETLFMQELMKSMRAASLRSGLLDNEGTELGTEMLDTEFAGRMAGLPGGLSDLIARQLERQMGLVPGPAGQAPKADAPLEPLSKGRGAASEVRIPQQAAAAFLAQHDAAARRAAQASGIPAQFMLSQAALETGWGRREITLADGRTSHNLFGIKADASWRGAVAEVTTTEFVAGRPQKVTARFRAYASYDESFADYARLIAGSPRYAQALAHARAAAADAGAFAQGLQRAGYATDPAYADKLTRVINTTLRMQRTMT
jgi:flagellar protein FlgJ